MTFKDKVVYQIYPKSFLDTNNDGVGDLEGIRQKLPYLADLGVDMIWMNPFYPSPQKDNGYDISDYTAVDARFGTMAEFEKLVQEAQTYGIGIMLDMVLNHVSIEHEWFQKALAGDKKYQDYFILRDEPTDWVSKFGGNAWEKFGDTDKYYLHLFDKTQADLNWRNPQVRKELFEVVNFWKNKGVKGFRLDVINVIGKDEILQNNSENEGKAEYTDKPITHDYLQELNRQTFGSDESIITVGEMSSTSIENCILYTQPERKELSMVFNFHHLKVDYEDGQKWTKTDFDFMKLKELLHSWGKEMSDNSGWNALFWNNHDQPRALNRFIDVENYRVEGAKMLAAAIHLNRGTPYIYMGEEIGMIDPDFARMDNYVDVECLNAFDNLFANGKSHEEAFEIVKTKSRDNSRVPMQWDDSTNAGFSQTAPWLSVGKSYKEINVKKELAQGDIHSFYKKLIALRKQYSVISEGDYQPYLEADEQVYAYIREDSTAKVLVVNNFYGKERTVSIPKEFRTGNVLISNYNKKELSSTVDLAPYETLAIYLGK